MSLNTSSYASSKSKSAATSISNISSGIFSACSDTYTNTNTNPYYSTIYNGSPGVYTGVPVSSYGSMWKSSEKKDELDDLSYSVYFELDDDDKILSDTICEINDNTFVFNCKMIGNRMQPYEKLMELISDKKEISVKIVISDLLTLCYTKFQFIDIENNFKFNNGYCSLSKLKVKFKFDKILYDNERLSVKEKRSDKLNKILKNNE